MHNLPGTIIQSHCSLLDILESIFHACLLLHMTKINFDMSDGMVVLHVCALW
jgi:hypothetical protein